MVARHPEGEGKEGVWREIRHKWPIGLVLVVIIEFCFTLLGPRLWEDQAFDLVMRLRQKVAGDASSEMKLAFVDIDERAFRNWADNNVTDRWQIQKLVERVARDLPAAIVVDLDLSERRRDDSHLLEYLSTYGGTNAAPLILVRSLKAHLLPEQSEVRDPAPMIVDGLPLSGKPIYFGSAGYLLASDGIVRSWLLAEPICSYGTTGKDGNKAADEQKAMPSVELLVDLLTDGDKPREAAAALNDIRSVANFYYGDDCASPHAAADTIGLIPDHIISSRHLKGRIIYSIPWLDSYPAEVSAKFRYFRADTLITDRANNKPPHMRDDPRLFQGTIVVIGGSNDESRDTYATPLGAMPGGIILVNAINSLLGPGQLREFTPIPHFFIGVVIGMIVWFGLEIVRIEYGLIPAVLGGIVAGLLSLYLIGYGVWIDPYGPIAAALAHVASKVLEPSVRDWHKHGLRALFSPGLRE